MKIMSLITELNEVATSRAVGGLAKQIALQQTRDELINAKLWEN
jgi:hypothetical protein